MLVPDPKAGKDIPTNKLFWWIVTAKHSQGKQYWYIAIEKLSEKENYGCCTTMVRIIAEYFGFVR